MMFRLWEIILCEFVLISIPGAAGVVQEEITREVFKSSTMHNLQAPDGLRLLWWQSLGISIPYLSAAFKIVVPTGTVILPSLMVNVIVSNRLSPLCRLSELNKPWAVIRESEDIDLPLILGLKAA